MITRERCVVCAQSLHRVYSFRDFPIYMGVSDTSEHETSDMEWAQCVCCGCIQLSSLVELEKLYKVPHNPAVGRTWDLHNKNFSSLVTSHSPRSVLDVGGANLKLANLISHEDSVTRYDVIDFSAEKYEVKSVNNKINLIVGSIENYARSNLVDCIILSHTLEHLYEPVSSLAALRECLTEDGKIYVSIPNVKAQLADGFLNALHFEHTYFIDHDYIEMIGEKAGLKLLQRQDFSDYNSFYVFGRCEARNREHPEIGAASVAFATFVRNLREDVEMINSSVIDQDYFIFGAHIFTQYLVNMGLLTGRVVSIIDNDLKKEGKLLYGTNLIVSKPEIISSSENPLVLLRVAQYEKEIKEQLLSINRNVRFL